VPGWFCGDPLLQVIRGGIVWCREVCQCQNPNVSPQGHRHRIPSYIHCLLLTMYECYTLYAVNGINSSKTEWMAVFRRFLPPPPLFSRVANALSLSCLSEAPKSETYPLPSPRTQQLPIRLELVPVSRLKLMG
jgi:hypothetical protein